MIYPGDKKVHYDVNTDGQITAMTDWNNHKTTYEYDKNGRVVKTTNWNGVIEERSYNTAGQVLTIMTSLHDKTLTDYKYTYDSDGNLVKDGSQVAYQYDKLNRLLKGQGNYTYDAVGNITASGNHKMIYDDDSRLTSIDDNKTSIDKDGNLTNYSMSGKTHTASYNSQNQLTKYDDLWYTYDADGNRVSAGDTKFIYDDNGHLLSDGVNTYVYGASGVVGYYNKDGKFITYLFNQRGDVVKETNESGSTTNSFDYNDYGKLIGSDKAADSVFGYGGQYGAVTDKNGLVFLQTRYYNPEIMRFMNRDMVRGSITDTKSLNRFAYVEGNPLTYVDPNGQAATWLKNNWFSLAKAITIAGISYAFPVVGVTIAAVSITHDLAEHNYTGLVLDTLGIVLPGVSKLARSGVGLSEAIDAAKDFHATSLLNFSKAAGRGSRQLSLAGGAGNVSYTAEKLTSESISSLDDISRLGKTFLKSTKSGKPKNAPDVKKWIAKGGKIDVDNEGTWTYTNPDGVSVGYPGGEVDFKSAGYVDFEYDIGHFENRNAEINRSKRLYPDESIGHTWHHSAQQNGLLQAVPTEIHQEFTHFGGISKFVNKRNY